MMILSFIIIVSFVIACIFAIILFKKINKGKQTNVAPDFEVIVCRDVAEIFCNTVSCLNKLCAINKQVQTSLEMFISSVSINKTMETHQLKTIEDEVNFREKEVKDISTSLRSFKFSSSEDGKIVLQKHNLSVAEVASAETCVQQSVQDILNNFMSLRQQLRNSQNNLLGIHFALARTKCFQYECNALYYGALEGMCLFPNDSLTVYYEMAPRWDNMPSGITLKSFDKKHFRMYQEMEFQKSQQCLDAAKRMLDNAENDVDNLMAHPLEEIDISLSEDISRGNIPDELKVALTDSDGESCSSDISFSESKELVFNPITDEFEYRNPFHLQDDGSIIVTEMSREGFCGSLNDTSDLSQPTKGSVNCLLPIIRGLSKKKAGKTSFSPKSSLGQAPSSIGDTFVGDINGRIPNSSRNLPVGTEVSSRIEKSDYEKTQKAIEYNTVYSSVFAPAEIALKRHMIVQVYLHLLEETDMVKELANEADKNTERRGYDSLEVKLKKGDTVEIELNINGDILYYNSRKTVMWQGSFVKRAFDFVVPSDITVSELSCSVNIFVNGAIVGEMIFLTSIVDSPRQLNTNIFARPTKKLFISYSHKDIKFAEKIAKIHEALGIDVFFDKHRLKAGFIYSEEISQFIQTADTFVLCWSENAAKSDYVEKERQKALSLAYPQC